MDQFLHAFVPALPRDGDREEALGETGDGFHAQGVAGREFTLHHDARDESQSRPGQRKEAEQGHVVYLRPHLRSHPRARDERVELDAQGAAPGREEEGKPLKPSGERLAGNPEWRASD